MVAVRIPALTGPLNLSPDACEYIDIARNVAAGDGLVLKIRAYFFGDGLGLPYPAMSLRSPLFPLVAGHLLSLFRTDAVFRLLNLVLFAVNISLVFLLIGPLMPGRLTLFALLLVGLSEPMFLTSIFPWAEQTAFFWLLLALWMASQGLHTRWRVTGPALQGIAAALAALSRPEYLLVGALLAVWLIRSGKPRAMTMAVFLAAFSLPLLLMGLINFRLYGRTFLPGDYLFHSRQYAAYFAWGKQVRPGVADFLAANWLWVGGRMLLNVVNYVAKLIGWKNLFALAVALPFVIRRGIHFGRGRAAQPLALVAAAFFAVYCLVWGGIDRERYLLPITSFLIPLCLLEMDRWRREARRPWIRLTCAGLMFVNLPLYLANIGHAGIVVQRRARLAERFYAVPNSAWDNPDFEQLTAWIQAHVRPDEALCLENPFLLNYRTRRAAVVLPEQVDTAAFMTFLNEYGVRYWVNNTHYTKRSMDTLTRLEQAIRHGGGELAGRAGSYSIWRVPPSPAPPKSRPS